MADILYILNDPVHPHMVTPVDLPPKPLILDFNVDGYIGATPTMWTPEHAAACCYYSLCTAINSLQRYYAKPVVNWATARTLFIQPRAGRQLNAFYDRQAIRLFYGNDPRLNKVVYTSHSTDVFNHELGHAILDAIRPDLFNTQAAEIWAFHEAFGDIHAIINAFQHEFSLEALMNETGKNLRNPSFITNIGEELGTAIYNSTAGRMGHLPNTLRSLLNQFTYVVPETLPMKGMDNQLTANPHSFSRVFSGAWYDILVEMFEHYKQSMPPIDALKAARDRLALYTYGALPIAPATIRFFDAMAKAMLVMDKSFNYEFNAIMNKCFIARGILRMPVRPMLSLDWTAFKGMIDPATDEVMEHGEVAVMRTKNTQIFTLPGHMVNVETPADVYYEFNGTGECVDVITASNGELLDHAYFCVDFLKSNDMIRPDISTPFEITEEGNLVRCHYACGCSGASGGCCFDNATNPEQPEYGKGYKLKNNRGCGCNGVSKSSCVSPTAKTSNCSGVTTPSVRIVTSDLVR